MAFIRPYNSTTSDFESCKHIFRETADASLDTEAALTIASYLWCKPYLRISPSTCFVLDDGTGKVTGYCIGTSDTADFCRKWLSEYLPSLTSPEDKTALRSCDGNSKAESLRRMLVEDPEEAFNGGVQGLWNAFPGHLHIDLLPSHQGQGHGPKLLAALFEALRRQGCTDVHLGMVAGNSGALRFYERLGFWRYPGLQNETGEKGREGNTIVLVKSL